MGLCRRTFSTEDAIQGTTLLVRRIWNMFDPPRSMDVSSGGIGDINYLEIPKEISGVDARIIGLVGKFFPTGAHRVGATYGCLAPYLVTGRFNPEYHKAVWPVRFSMIVCV